MKDSFYFTKKEYASSFRGNPKNLVIDSNGMDVHEILRQGQFMLYYSDITKLVSERRDLAYLLICSFAHLL